MRIRYVSVKSIGQFVAPVRVSLTLSATKHTYTLCFVELDRSVCRSCAGFVDVDFTKHWYLQCFIEPDIVVWLVGWSEKGGFRSPEAPKEYRKGF